MVFKPRIFSFSKQCKGEPGIIVYDGYLSIPSYFQRNPNITEC